MATQDHRRRRFMAEFGGCPGACNRTVDVIVSRSVNAHVRRQSREIFQDKATRAQDRDANRNVNK
jgi:hypothetical protein